MNIEIQSSPELVHLGKLIESMSVGMLTHVDGDGTLMSQPMTPLEMDSNGTLWFFIDLRSTKIEHLGAVNLSFTDSTRATYVSLSGRGALDGDHERIEHLWTPAARPWFPAGPESRDLALLKFVPDTAEYWDAPNSKMVRVLAMAASVVAGKPIGLGEHDTLTDLPSRTVDSAIK